MGWKRYREGQKPDIGIEVLAYHEDWVNPDFAPDGVRAGFINGDGNFVSAYWWDHQDDYIAISKDRCEDKPDFFKNHISNTEPQYWTEKPTFVKPRIAFEDVCRYICEKYGYSAVSKLQSKSGYIIPGCYIHYSSNKIFTTSKDKAEKHNYIYIDI